MISLISFVLFAVCAVFALGVITRKNPVYSVLCLAMVFVSVSAVFLTLQVEFVAMALITLYLGAIVVLFLFVVMMIANADQIPIYVSGRARRISRYGIVLNMTVIGTLGLFIALSMYSGSAGLVKVIAKYPALDSATKFGCEAIGKVLFSGFNFEFIILSFILLVAVIAAVTLTSQDIDPGKKRQNVAAQLARSHSVKLVRVDYGQGVRW